MKYTLLIAGLFVLTSVVHAQVKKTYKVNPGEKVIEALPHEAVYMYPQFKDGVVNFRNNKVGAAKLNYNRLLDQVQFINEKQDTLSLDDEATIASIYIGTDTFYFFKGYVKAMSSVKNIKFAVKKILTLSNKQKIGGMGELSSASIDTYQNVSSSQGMMNIIPKEILTFAEYSYFFIGDAYNNFKALNKKSLLNMYAGQQAAVENYLSQHSVSYTNEEDVIKLIAFLRTL